MPIPSDKTVIYDSNDPNNVWVIPKSDLAASSKDGWLEVPSDQQETVIKAQEALKNPIRAGIEGLARGATFGASDWLATAAGADEEAMRMRKELNPVAASVGEIGSLFLPGGAAIGGAGKLAKAFVEGEKIANILGKASSAVGKVIPGAKTAANIAGKITKAAAPGAAEGLAMGLTEASSEVALGQHELDAELWTNVGLSTALGAGTGLGIEALGAVKRFMSSEYRMWRSDVIAEKIGVEYNKADAAGKKMIEDIARENAVKLGHDPMDIAVGDVDRIKSVFRESYSGENVSEHLMHNISNELPDVIGEVADRTAGAIIGASLASLIYGHGVPNDLSEIAVALVAGGAGAKVGATNMSTRLGNAVKKVITDKQSSIRNVVDVVMGTPNAKVIKEATAIRDAARSALNVADVPTKKAVYEYAFNNYSKLYSEINDVATTRLNVMFERDLRDAMTRGELPLVKTQLTNKSLNDARSLFVNAKRSLNVDATTKALGINRHVREYEDGLDEAIRFIDDVVFKEGLPMVPKPGDVSMPNRALAFVKRWDDYKQMALSSFENGKAFNASLKTQSVHAASNQNVIDNIINTTFKRFDDLANDIRVNELQKVAKDITTKEGVLLGKKLEAIEEEFAKSLSNRDILGHDLTRQMPMKLADVLHWSIVTEPEPNETPEQSIDRLKGDTSTLINDPETFQTKTSGFVDMSSNVLPGTVPLINQSILDRLVWLDAQLPKKNKRGAATKTKGYSRLDIEHATKAVKIFNDPTSVLGDALKTRSFDAKTMRMLDDVIPESMNAVRMQIADSIISGKANVPDRKTRAMVELLVPGSFVDTRRVTFPEVGKKEKAGGNVTIDASSSKMPLER